MDCGSRGPRVSLDSIVCAFRRRASPETIAQSFSRLRLEEVYGAIAYYLVHQEDIDSRLEINQEDSLPLESSRFKSRTVQNWKRHAKPRGLRAGEDSLPGRRRPQRRHRHDAQTQARHRLPNGRCSCRRAEQNCRFPRAQDHAETLFSVY
jgi:hypothetical protein